MVVDGDETGENNGGEKGRRLTGNFGGEKAK